MRAVSIQGLRGEIRTLQMAMAQNNMELKRETKAGRTMRLPELLGARAEILLSIAHRQSLIIEIQANEIKFLGNGKVAA